MKLFDVALVACLPFVAGFASMIGGCARQSEDGYEAITLPDGNSRQRRVMLEVALSELLVGKYMRFSARGEDSNWVIHTDAGVKAFRGVDTLLGHELEYEASQHRFIPVCRNHVNPEHSNLMIYDWHGAPLVSRPPRPLEQYWVVVRNGVVRVVDLIDRQYEGPDWATKSRYD